MSNNEESSRKVSRKVTFRLSEADKRDVTVALATLRLGMQHVCVGLVKLLVRNHRKQLDTRNERTAASTLVEVARSMKLVRYNPGPDSRKFVPHLERNYGDDVGDESVRRKPFVPRSSGKGDPK